jgi:O-antigen/teichoic acid export membrane protein
MIIQLKYPDIVTDEKEQNRRDNRPLLWIVCVGILTSLFLWLVGSQILQVLYGSSFDLAQNLAWKISVACIPYCISNYLQHELIASNSMSHVKWLIVCAVAEAGLMYFLPQTPSFIAFALFLSGCMSVCVTLQDRMLSLRT